MDNYSDSYLIDLINESSEEAKDIIYDKYKYIIDIITKKYISTATKLGIDTNDLYQEALVGFADALNSFREDKFASLPTFISLCVERRLQVCIIKAGRLKNKLLNESLSLDYKSSPEVSPLMEIISDDSKNDPLVNISKEEEYQELLDSIKESLSDNEYMVFTLLSNGLSYKEIASILDIEPKKADNTIQRVKNKIKRILDERND